MPIIEKKLSVWSFRLAPVKAPSHARLRQLVTWPVKVGNSLSLSDWFKNKFEGWLVIYESPGVGRAADSGSGKDWFEPFLCCHLIPFDKKLFFYYLSPLSSLILCLLTAYCREQSCDRLHRASHPGGGGGWWGVKLPLCFMLLKWRLLSPLACFQYLYIPLKCWAKTDKFADPSQEIKWAVFSVVLSQNSYKIIVVEAIQGKNLIFDIFTARSSLP